MAMPYSNSIYPLYNSRCDLHPPAIQLNFTSVYYTLTNTHCTVRKWCGGVGAGRRGSRLFQDSAHGMGHAARGPNIAEFRAVEVREPLNQKVQALVGCEGRR
jgi:hypothetical protein